MINNNNQQQQPFAVAAAGNYIPAPQSNAITAPAAPPSLLRAPVNASHSNDPMNIAVADLAMDSLNTNQTYHQNLSSTSSSISSNNMLDSKNMNGNNNENAGIPASSNQPKKKRKCGVPVSLLVVTMSLLSLLAIAGPVGGIWGFANKRSLDEMTSLIMAQAVNNTAIQVQNVIDVPTKLLRILLDSPLVYNAMQMPTGLANQTDVYYLMYTLVSTSPYLNGVGCVGYPGLLNGGVQLTNNLPNTTFISNYKIAASNNEAMWMDHSTNQLLLEAGYNNATRLYTVDPHPGFDFNWAAFLSTQSFYTYMITYPGDERPFYNITYFNGTMVTGVAQAIVIPSINTTHAAYTCSFGLENSGSLDVLFKNLKITPNTFSMLIDATTPSGVLIAHSLDQPVFTTANINGFFLGQPYAPDTVPVNFTQSFGRALLAQYGDYSKIPRDVATFSVTMNNTQWYINTKFLTRPDNWVVVTCLPAEDLLGELYAAQRVSLIAALSAGVAGLAFVAFISFVAMRPLARLAKAMEMLTRLEFSALEDGDILTARSYILEVRKLQETFMLMCRAFASGIRRNKALLLSTRGVNSTQDTSSQQQQQGAGQPIKSILKKA